MHNCKNPENIRTVCTVPRQQETLLSEMLHWMAQRSTVVTVTTAQSTMVTHGHPALNKHVLTSFSENSGHTTQQQCGFVAK